MFGWLRAEMARASRSNLSPAIGLSDKWAGRILIATVLSSRMPRARGSADRGWSTIIRSSRLTMSIFHPTPGSRRLGLYALLVLMGVAVALWLWTREPAGGPSPATTARGTAAPAPLVDQSPLKTAQTLLAFAANPEEQRLAQEAVRLADHEVDLAFAEALRRAAEHQP